MRLALAFALLLPACGGDGPPPDPPPAEPQEAVDPYADAPVVEPGPDGKHPALLAPHLARETAPETFRVVLDTTDGEVEIECVRAWSPHGVDRFWNLVRIGFYTDTPFHPVFAGSWAGFGVPLDIPVRRAWRSAALLDEPAVQSNRRGYVSLSRPASHVNSRCVEVFVNLADNPDFDRTTAPIGRVVRGLKVVDGLCDEYSRTIDPMGIQNLGRLYFLRGYPKLDWVRSARIAE